MRRSGGGGRFDGEPSDEGHDEVAEVEGDRPPPPRAEFVHAEESFFGDARYTPALHNAGAMDVECPFCRALHFRVERTSGSTNAVPKFGTCCHNGAVALPAFPDPPEPLKSYLEADTPQRRRVVNHLRLLNNALSLAAVRSEIPPALPGGSAFDPQVRLHGRLTHVVGPLLPGAGQAASFLQAYFLDSEENGRRLAAVCRAAIRGGRGGAAPGGFGRVDASNLTPVERGLFDALRALYAMLREHNALVRRFLTAHERVRAIETLAGHPIQELRIIIEAEARPDGAHVRVFNAPTRPEDGEAAALLPVAELEVTPEHAEERRPPARRDVALALRGSPRSAFGASAGAAGPILQNIPADNPMYDPAAYTLLLPRGTAGWHTQIARHRQGRQKCVSAVEYLSYYLFIRAGQSNYIHRCGRLFGAWAVDGYVKVEHFNLQWLRFNQTKLLCAKYSHLIDALPDGQQDGERIGRGILLNDGFVGSPRYMHTKYAQCMTSCRALGRPTFFITFTCNPKWKEIVDALLPGQDARDRPDLLSRVFEIKYRRFLVLLTKLGVFGRYAGHVSVTEFQKRGLPHVHLILWLHKCDRPMSAQDYDKWISSEIPPENAAELRRLVLEFNVHGPCGPANPESLCMSEGKCGKYFPKPFAACTVDGDGEYPSYRRRSPEAGGETATIRRNGRSHVVDNSLIVPYSPQLTLELGCHVNVEIVGSRSAFKYLFKYVCKGNDSAMISVVRANAGVGAAATTDAAGAGSSPEEGPVAPADLAACAVRPCAAGNPAAGDASREPRDEIQAFQQTRYCGESEACTRAFGFDIHRRNPPVMKLSFHLGNEQPVYYQ